MAEAAAGEITVDGVIGIEDVGEVVEGGEEEVGGVLELWIEEGFGIMAKWNENKKLALSKGRMVVVDG